MHASAHGREAPRAGPAHLYRALSEDPDSPLEANQSLARTGLLTLAAVALLSAPPLFWASSTDAAAQAPVATQATKEGGAPGGGAPDDGASGDDPDGTTAPGQTTSTAGGKGGTSAPGTSAPGVTTAPGETSQGGQDTTNGCPPGAANGGSTTIGEDTSTAPGEETSTGGHATNTTAGETASATDVDMTAAGAACEVPPPLQPPVIKPPEQQPPPEQPPPVQPPPVQPPPEQPPPAQPPPEQPPVVTPPQQQPPTVAPPGAPPQAQPPAPQNVVIPSRVESPSARLSVPSGCPPQVFLARVRGRSIARVVFTIDGRRVATVTRPDGAGVWKYRVNTRKYSVGRHRLVARVSFGAAARRSLRQAGERPVRALTVTFAVCARKASTPPRFTG